MSLAARLSDLAVRVANEFRNVRSEMAALGAVPTFAQVLAKSTNVVSRTTSETLYFSEGSNTVNVGPTYVGVQGSSGQTSVMAATLMFTANSKNKVINYGLDSASGSSYTSLNLPRADGTLATEEKVAEMLNGGSSNAASFVILNAGDPVPAGTAPGTLIFRKI